MDILNWLYLAKNKFVRTAVDNPKDLMIFGSKVGANKRGDIYQNYAVSAGDFAASLGIGKATDVTYDELYAAVTGSTLVPGQWYRLTDYKSSNFLNGWITAATYSNPSPNPNFNRYQIHNGDTEVLLLQAISTFEIAEIGYSETFPGDIVTYRPYTNTMAVPIGPGLYTGASLPYGGTVGNFNLQWDGNNAYIQMPAGYPALFGYSFYIYFNASSTNFDGRFEVLRPGTLTCDYPMMGTSPRPMTRIRVEENGYKVVLLDITEADYNSYVNNSLYLDCMYSRGDAYGWMSRRKDTIRNINVPFDFRGIRYRRWEVNLTVVNPNLGTGYYFPQDRKYINATIGYLTTTGNYIDVPVFGGIDNSYDNFNIQWEGTGSAQIYGSYLGVDNNVFLNSTGYIRCNNNIFCDNMYENTFTGEVRDNIIPYLYNPMRGNILSAFLYNNFSSVTFQSNYIYQMQSNSLTNSTVSSNIFNTFSNNTLDVTVLSGNNMSCTISGNVFSQLCQMFNCTSTASSSTFRKNEIKGTMPTATAFTASTHVYGDYDTSLFTRSNGTTQLSYIDGTNTVQYTAINA